MEISDGLRKIFLAGVGAVATTADAAKDLVDQLVKKGELTVDDSAIIGIIRYKDVYNAIDHMSNEELEALKEKLSSVQASKVSDASESVQPEQNDSGEKDEP